MTRALIAVALSALLIACGGATNTPVSPEPPSSVRVAGTAFGTVLDVQANRGIPGATLTWTVSLSPDKTSTVTDAMGFYAVKLPPADAYGVTIDTGDGRSHGGLAILPITVEATDFLLDTAQCDLRYGIIIDAVTRRPVSGAQIRWGDVVVSAADGSYQVSRACELGSFGTGTTAITVTHPAYITAQHIDTRAEFLGRSGDEIRIDIALTPR